MTFRGMMFVMNPLYYYEIPAIRWIFVAEIPSKTQKKSHHPPLVRFKIRDNAKKNVKSVKLKKTCTRCPK